MNVYSKLLNIQNTILDINDILIISLEEPIAEIYNKSIKIDDKYNHLIDSIEDGNIDDYIIKILRKCNFHISEPPTGSVSMPLKVFIDVRDEVINEIIGNQTKLEKYIYDNFINIQNKEVQNKEYYNSFLGYKYIDNCGIKYLSNVLNVFKKARKDKVKELHHVMRSYSRLKGVINHSAITNMDYYSTMGLGYMYNCDVCLRGEYDLEHNKQSIMKPLSNINMDYCKNKIHVLEVELCYLNANIKAIKKVLIPRKKKERNMPDDSD